MLFCYNWFSWNNVSVNKFPVLITRNMEVVSRLWYTLLCVVIPPSIVAASRVLLLPWQFGSHIHEQVVLGEELVRRGHEVHVVLGDRVPRQEAIRQTGVKVLNFRYPPDVLIFQSDNFDSWVGEKVFTKAVGMKSIGTMSDMTLRDCELILKDQELITNIKRIKFDLCIVDCVVMSPCLMLLPEWLSIPHVAMTSTVLPWWVRTPSLPSFVPTNISPYTDNMTFKQRLLNTLSYFIFMNLDILKLVANFPGLTDTRLIMEYAPKYRNAAELYSSSQFYIVLTDHILEWPSPIMPNMVKLPGITLQQAKPLNPEFLRLVEQSLSGVVLVSFGSVSVHMPGNIIQKFLRTFGQLEQTVIWKLPKLPQFLEGQVPPNVKTFAWIPQNDLLGHSNIKLFVTHCGNNGQYEALYHSKPMLGFPLFSDQPHNAIRMEHKGVGIKMDIMNFSETELQENILTLLGNEKVQKKLQRYGSILKARKLPKEEAAEWVEHILKYSSKHLRSAALDLSLYQFLCLDILFVMFLTLICACTLFVGFLKVLMRKVL